MVDILIQWGNRTVPIERTPHHTDSSQMDSACAFYEQEARMLPGQDSPFLPRLERMRGEGCAMAGAVDQIAPPVPSATASRRGVAATEIQQVSVTPSAASR